MSNFKAFGQRQVIPLAPITLLFGQNSAGKSSIVHALLLLKQTAAAADLGRGVLLPKGNLVNLGSFRDMIFRHELRETCEIAPMFDNDLSEFGSTRMGPPPAKASAQPLLTAGMGFIFGFENQTRTVNLRELRCYVSDGDRPVFGFSPSAEAFEEGRDRLRFGRLFGGTASQSERVKYVVRLSHMAGDHPFVRASYDRSTKLRAELLDRVRKLQATISSKQTQKDEIVDVIYYILRTARAEGPKSERPKLDDVQTELGTLSARLSSYSFETYLEDLTRRNKLVSLLLDRFLATDYALPREELRSVEYLVREYGPAPRVAQELDPAGLVVQLSTTLGSILDGAVYLGPLREFPERYYIYGGYVPQNVGKSGALLPDLLFHRLDLVDETNKWLRRFETGYALAVKSLKGEGEEDVFALQFQDERTDTAVTIQDVGFGISQVLPVVAQSLISTNRLLLIEQPEIHIHPRLQAEVGSLLAEAIGPKRRNQVVVETHSEHIVLRLMAMIRQEDLLPTDVAVIYVTRGERGSVCTHLKIDRDGNFTDEWPEGFFEERYRELFSQK